MNEFCANQAFWKQVITQAVRRVNRKMEHTGCLVDMYIPVCRIGAKNGAIDDRGSKETFSSFVKFSCTVLVHVKLTKLRESSFERSCKMVPAVGIRVRSKVVLEAVSV